MDTQPIPQPLPQPRQPDPDLQMIQDFLWLIGQGCTFKRGKSFNLKVHIWVTRPGRNAFVMGLDLREPKKSFAELLHEVRRLYNVLS